MHSLRGWTFSDSLVADCLHPASTLTSSLSLTKTLTQPSPKRITLTLTLDAPDGTGGRWRGSAEGRAATCAPRTALGRGCSLPPANRTVTRSQPDVQHGTDFCAAPWVRDSIRGRRQPLRLKKKAIFTMINECSSLPLTLENIATVPGLSDAHLERDGHNLETLLVQHRRQVAHELAHVHHDANRQWPLPLPPP